MNEIELKLRENRRKRMNEERLREGYYLVSYNYDGDELSDYRSTLLVKADSEEEALQKARDKKSDGRHFEIDKSHEEFPDGYVDSLETWRSKYPKSNYDIQEKKEDKMIRAIHTPVSTATGSQLTEGKYGTESDILEAIEDIVQGKKSREETILADASLLFGRGGEGMIYLPSDQSRWDIEISPEGGATKIGEPQKRLSLEAYDTSEAVLFAIEDILDGKKSAAQTILSNASFLFGTGYGTIYLADSTRLNIEVAPTQGAVKIEAKESQINEAFEESEAILQGLTKVRTEAREAYSKYVNMNDLAECKAILTYLVKDSKTLLDLVTDALNGKSVDESRLNESPWDDEEDEDDWDFDDERHHADEESTVYSNWKRLRDLQGDFWTNLEELVEDIEDQLGYEVVFKSREYLSLIDPEATDDAEYKLTLSGTERTIVVDLDSSYPM